MKDWTALREQYVTTAISLRDLARESHTPFGSLAKAARRQDWNLARRVHGDKGGTGAVTVASDNPLSLPQRSSALKVSLVRELERDVEAVQQHHPATLEIAAQRQGVLRDVATTAKAALDWGSGVPVPAIRIAVLAAVTISPLPALPEPPASQPESTPDEITEP